ncbi:hypothetical protein [Chelativorans sp.]|uniref:hypothetical protein n=1 Tax=Chelativorans sp. TaxID=2203393 RepID=UPI002811793F|nr:hypothetical protein [Chelativorans sp.]
MNDIRLPRKPKKQRGGWLKNPKLPRDGEIIGGGFWVFRRGDSTGRIRPSVWPFEYGSEEAATVQADKLARANPGQIFVVVGQKQSILYLVKDEVA